MMRQANIKAIEENVKKGDIIEFTGIFKRLGDEWTFHEFKLL